MTNGHPNNTLARAANQTTEVVRVTAIGHAVALVRFILEGREAGRVDAGTRELGPNFAAVMLETLLNAVVKLALAPAAPAPSHPFEVVFVAVSFGIASMPIRHELVRAVLSYCADIGVDIWLCRRRTRFCCRRNPYRRRNMPEWIS